MRSCGTSRSERPLLLTRLFRRALVRARNRAGRYPRTTARAAVPVEREDEWQPLTSVGRDHVHQRTPLLVGFPACTRRISPIWRYWSAVHQLWTTRWRSQRRGHCASTGARRRGQARRRRFGDARADDPAADHEQVEVAREPSCRWRLRGSTQPPDDGAGLPVLVRRLVKTPVTLSCRALEHASRRSPCRPVVARPSRAASSPARRHAPILKAGCPRTRRTADRDASRRCTARIAGLEGARLPERSALEAHEHVAVIVQQGERARTIPR